jgi:hypothetical protein
MFKRGDVYRLGTWTFADAVVVSVDARGHVTLARPYLYASDTGAPLVGVETIEYLSPKEMEHYTKIDEGRIV